MKEVALFFIMMASLFSCSSLSQISKDVAAIRINSGAPK